MITAGTRQMFPGFCLASASEVHVLRDFCCLKPLLLRKTKVNAATERAPNCNPFTQAEAMEFLKAGSLKYYKWIHSPQSLFKYPLSPRLHRSWW